MTRLLRPALLASLLLPGLLPSLACPVVGIIGGTGDGDGDEAGDGDGDQPVGDGDGDGDATGDGDGDAPGDGDGDGDVADLYVEGQDAAVLATATVMEVACERLHGECEDVCDDPFTYCGDSVQDCVEQNTLAWTEDLSAPWSNQLLAEQCALEVAGRSCLDLSPNSYACERAIVEGCADDSGYGPNYVPELAAPLALPGTVTLRLCDNVSEYYLVELDEGDVVDATNANTSSGEVWVKLLAFTPAGDGFFDTDQVDFKSLEPGEQGQLDPAPVAGVYLLEIEQWDLTGDSELTFALGFQDPDPLEITKGQAAEIVFGALCERLHGDCSEVCARDDVACQESVLACVEAFSAEVNPGGTVTQGEANTCAVALAGQSCDALTPSTLPACDDLHLSIEEGCAGSPYGFASPTSPALAELLGAPPVSLEAFVCNTDQYFAVQLEAGQSVTVTRTTATLGDMWLSLVGLGSVPGEQVSIDTEFLGSDETSEVLTGPSVAGTYYLEVYMSSVSDTVGLAVQ